MRRLFLCYNSKMRQGFELIARAVIVRGGKILMTSAKGDARRFLPGGHVEFGERAENALQRELKEELGVRAKVGKLIGVTENSFMQKGKRHHELNLVFMATIPVGKVVSSEKHIEFHWENIKTFSRVSFVPPNFKRALIRWFKEKKFFWVSDV